jgi:hypothetical protein
MLEGNMDWLTDTPFLTKERGFFIADQKIAEGLMPIYIRRRDKNNIQT